jgi:hypothetical protein
VSSPTGTADAVDATSSVGQTRRRLGRAAVAVWTCALAAYCVRYGFPFDRANMSLWILSGLLAASVGRPWRRVGRIFRDWLPFILLLYLYDYSRGAADSLGATVQVEGPILWDRVLFLGADPAVWLQQRFYDPQAVHWWDKVGALIYISHFFVVWVIAAVLYQRNRDHWFRWARALIALSFAGLVTYALLPAAPPWYAAEEGLLPPLDRISTRGLDAMGLSFAESLVDQGRAVTNDVAAIPSLHTAFAVLVAVWFFRRVPQRHRWWAQPLLVAYPVAMLATLVYSGEHYVIDGIIGAAYVVAVLAGLAWWDRWRAGRREAGAGPGSPAPAPDSVRGDLGQQPGGVLEDRSAHRE